MARTLPSATHQLADHSMSEDDEEEQRASDSEIADHPLPELFVSVDNTSYAFTFHSTLLRYPEEIKNAAELIKDHGGIVVEDETTADIILADNETPAYHKLYRRVTQTTSGKHVEALEWVETCVGIGQVQFTRDVRAQTGGRRPGDVRHMFTPSDKEHLVYYLAHRSPYVLGAQKRHYHGSRTYRPYDDNMLRAGNRIWKELCQSTRPWARKHSWHSFREQYVRNRAQYDFWIQRYVEEHPSLLDELAPRLIQDFLDEPGADEEELSQEEHGYVIARAPDHPTEGGNGRRSWPPVRGVGRDAVTRSRTPIQAISRPAGSISRPRATHDADESWLVNSSDEDTEPSEPPRIEARPRSSPQPRLSPHQSPRPTRLSTEPRHSVPRQTPPPAHSGISAAEGSTTRTSGNGAEDEIRAELDRQISLLDENGLTEAPEDGSNAPQSSVQRHRGKGKPKAFKIKRLSQNVNPSLQARHEEIADSELVYHIGNEGESAMIRRSSTSGTPVRGAQTSTSAFGGSPSSRRTSLSERHVSLAEALNAQFKPFKSQKRRPLKSSRTSLGDSSNTQAVG